MSFDPKPWALKAADCPWRVNTMFHTHPSFSCSKYCYQLDIWRSLDEEYGSLGCWTQPKKDPLTNRIDEFAMARWDAARDRKLAERDRHVNLILAEIMMMK